MGFLNKIFGFRWSLYFVKNKNQLIYVMHENSVIRMVGYVMRYFADGGKPVEPWHLYLNFNHKHKTIELVPELFTSDGEGLSSLLLQKIKSIDPGWQVKGSEPIFVEVSTKKRIKINGYSRKKIDIQAMLDNIDSPREVTFYRVMDEIFGIEK